MTHWLGSVSLCSILSTSCCNLLVSDVFVTSMRLSHELSLLPGRGNRHVYTAGSLAGSVLDCVENGPRLPEDVLLGGEEACGKLNDAGNLCPVEILNGAVTEFSLFDRFSGSSCMFSLPWSMGLRLPSKSSLLYLLSMLHSSYGGGDWYRSLSFSGSLSVSISCFGVIVLLLMGDIFGSSLVSCFTSPGSVLSLDSGATLAGAGERAGLLRFSGMSCSSRRPNIGCGGSTRGLTSCGRCGEGCSRF